MSMDGILLTTWYPVACCRLSSRHDILLDERPEEGSRVTCDDGVERTQVLQWVGPRPIDMFRRAVAGAPGEALHLGT
jgi:hypothetical protein